MSRNKKIARHTIIKVKKKSTPDKGTKIIIIFERKKTIEFEIKWTRKQK